LRECGLSEEGIGLAEAGYANTMCSAIEQLPFKCVVQIEHAWSRDGDGLFRLDEGMDAVVEHMARNLTIHKDCEVVKIDYSDDDDVVVYCKNGRKFVGCKAVCTVPLNIIKRGSIKFSPNLPKEYQFALDTFRMYPAVKVCLEFSTKFWPTELHGMICGNSFIPEFWFEDPEIVTGGLSPESAVVGTGKRTPTNKTFLATGYACAKAADIISAMKRDEVVQKALEQLDEMWGNQQINDMLLDKRYGAQRPPEADIIVKNPPKPATLYYQDAMLVDWGKNQFILGGYSSPSFGSSAEMREIWSVPVNGKLYFGGEAFNRESIMTLHGAMETSIVNANNILRSFGKGDASTPNLEVGTHSKVKKAKL